MHQNIDYTVFFHERSVMTYKYMKKEMSSEILSVHVFLPHLSSQFYLNTPPSSEELVSMRHKHVHETPTQALSYSSDNRYHLSRRRRNNIAQKGKFNVQYCSHSCREIYRRKQIDFVRSLNNYAISVNHNKLFVVEFGEKTIIFVLFLLYALNVDRSIRSSDRLSI